MICCETASAGLSEVPSPAWTPSSSTRAGWPPISRPETTLWPSLVPFVPSVRAIAVVSTESIVMAPAPMSMSLTRAVDVVVRTPSTSSERLTDRTSP